MAGIVLDTPLTLPCGATIKNRLGKSAMTEGLADEFNRATEQHVNLYKAWSAGGTGLLITGNIQIDRRYMERPGNVAIDGSQDSEQLRRLQAYASAATDNDTQCWVQIGHAGRQCDPLVNLSPVGPSDVGFKRLDNPMQTTACRALLVGEIRDIVKRFAAAARVCKQAGFTGVQLHAAHGYLLSSFLNPRANKRSDEYGGSLENRARILLESVAAVREAVGLDFAVGVKINSADFQKGGFTLEECARVCRWLDAAGVDLIELSGGNYENGAFAATTDAFSSDSEVPADGDPQKNRSTLQREAYFLTFVPAIRAAVRRAAVMVTGGMRSRGAMEAALRDGGCDLVGVGRPLCGAPDSPNDLFSGRSNALPSFETSLQLPGWLRWLNWTSFGPKITFGAQQMWYYHQERRIGAGLQCVSSSRRRPCLSTYMHAGDASASHLMQA